jgi:hypothetical protein
MPNRQAVRPITDGKESIVSSSLDMNQTGILEGTDKSSSVSYSWDYLRHYEEWFCRWKDEEINLIEIGVATGSSLHVWQRYFSKAHIVGVDINPECARFASERVSIEIGSQEDPSFLHRVCAKYPPTIIIDDGSHQAHHIVYTFEHMYPALRSGGLYIVEDLDFHFGEAARLWSNVPGYDPTAYFLELAKACMTRKNREQLWGTRRNVLETMDAVYFVYSAACIRKKATRNRPIDWEMARQYANERSLGAHGILRYAKYMLNNGRDVDEIVSQLRNIEADSRSVDVEFFKALAELQRMQGRLDQAIETLAKGAAIFGDNFDLLWRYGDWLVQGQRHEDGLRAMGRAASLCGDPDRTRAIVDMLVNYALSSNQQEVAAEALREAARASAHADCRQAMLNSMSRLAK